METFVLTLCHDLSFPPPLHLNILIQMKQQILAYLRSCLARLRLTYKEDPPLITHGLCEKMPLLPVNYAPFEETYFLHKHELYQFLERHMGLLGEEKKKVCFYIAKK